MPDSNVFDIINRERVNGGTNVIADAVVTIVTPVGTLTDILASIETRENPALDGSTIVRVESNLNADIRSTFVFRNPTVDRKPLEGGELIPRITITSTAL